MKRKLIIAMLAAAVCLMTAGCGNTGADDINTVSEVGQSSTEAMHELPEVSVEEIGEVSAGESFGSESTQADYLYGEEVVFKKGVKYNIEGRFDVEAADIYVGYDGTIYSEFEVNTADEKQKLTVYRNEAGYTMQSCLPRAVTPYMMEIKDVKEDEVMIIFSERVYPEPVVLSGNPDDEYVFDDYAYAIGDKVVLYFDKDIKVNGDALILAEAVANDLETKTGLKFKNDSIYSSLPGDGMRETYLGFDPWNGYDYYHYDKIGVFFIHDKEQKGWIACSTGRVVILIDEDGDFHNDSLNTIAHEMAHVLDRANHDNFANVLTEGFGAYWARQISMCYPEYIVGYRAEYGPDMEIYWGMSKDITEKTAEALYNDDYDRMGNPEYYNYGFQLLTYLYETYPTEQVNEFYDFLSGKLWARRLETDEYAEELLAMGFIGDASDNEFEIGVMKEFWGDDIFEKFGAWAKKNKKRFRDW